jgi:hypothetical protein
MCLVVHVLRLLEAKASVKHGNPCSWCERAACRIWISRIFARVCDDYVLCKLQILIGKQNYVWAVFYLASSLPLIRTRLVLD